MPRWPRYRWNNVWPNDINRWVVVAVREHRKISIETDVHQIPVIDGSCLHVPRPVQLNSRLIDGWVVSWAMRAPTARWRFPRPRWSERPKQQPAHWIILRNTIYRCKTVFYSISPTQATNGTIREPELRGSDLFHRRHDNPALPILSQKALFCRCSVATCWR